MSPTTKRYNKCAPVSNWKEVISLFTYVYADKYPVNGVSVIDGNKYETREFYNHQKQCLKIKISQALLLHGPDIAVCSICYEKKRGVPVPVLIFNPAITLSNCCDLVIQRKKNEEFFFIKIKHQDGCSTYWGAIAQ